MRKGEKKGEDNMMISLEERIRIFNDAVLWNKKSWMNSRKELEEEIRNLGYKLTEEFSVVYKKEEMKEEILDNPLSYFRRRMESVKNAGKECIILYDKYTFSWDSPNETLWTKIYVRR